MTQIFTDYQGLKVRLTDERRQHILAHPEMVELEPAIATALSNPEVVRQSNSDRTVHLYYRYHENTTVGDKWLCIVVKYLEGISNKSFP